MDGMIGQPQWGAGAAMPSPGMQGLNAIQPAMPPQGGNQPDPALLELIRKHLMSGGGGDLRNLMMALGPAAQAAGGMGQAAAMGQRMGIPAKTPGGVDAAEQMFNMKQPAPMMGGGAAGMGVGGTGTTFAPSVLPSNMLTDLIAAIMRSRGQGMNFPAQTAGSPMGQQLGVLPPVGRP